MFFDEELAGIDMYNILKNIDSRLYFNRVERGIPKLYAVFTFGATQQQEGFRSDATLLIYIFDNKGDDISELLALQKKFQKLHKKICSSENSFFIFNLISTYAQPVLVNSDGEEIRQRILTFDLGYYNKNIEEV